MSDNGPVFESPAFPEVDEDAADDDVYEDDPDDPDDSDDEQDEDDEEDVLPSGMSSETRSVTSEGNRASGGMPRAVLEHIARSIVDEPDAVQVDVADGRDGLTLSLHVAPGDMGRVIGKRGRIAQALRSVVRAAAAREGTEASVDIVD